MPSQVYTWKRFWCPRSGHIDLRDGGYLVNPDSEWGHFYKSDSVAFETISEMRCLVLLGEAGMGKTTATEQAYHQVSHKFSDSENVCLWFRLGDYDSDKQLCDAIFRDETLQAWRKGTNKLHLFLDSLDEGLLSIKILVRILKREIEQLPCDRLYFRITCRTADWKDSLEQKLKDKWGEENVVVYELAPLCRVDVIEAANRGNINSNDFLQEVFNKNAIPLAIKPITLKFLLGIYQNGRFPSSQKDLYEEGCLQLCEEVNPDRCDSGFTGNLDAKHRLVIASRIAALLLFSKRSAIWISPEYGKMPNSDIAIRDICIGKESINQQEFPVDENCIKEVLSVTELFSSRGPHRIGFAHQTYAEFLAARYLVHHETPLEQVMKLIASSEDSEFRLIPQLHETAAWLAGILPEVFREVMKTDPDVLLLSDVATAGETDKAALVESLLRLHNQEKLTYQYITWLYKNLNHPKLPDQLQLYICDSTKSINARNVAIDIAEACNVKAVQEYLADVALDPQQHSSVRINAAVAVCNLGDEKTKARLKPLAVAQIQNDVEEQLKGCGLRAVWPGNITAEEVFTTLIQPVSKSIGGRYQDFIAKELGQHLQISDLPVAFKWLKKQVTRRDLGYPFGELSDAIMLKAWEHLNKPEVMQEFTIVAFSRLKNHDVIIYDDSYKPITFSQVLKDDVQKRRQIVESIISIIPESDQEPLWLIGYIITAIVFEQDFQWLIQCIQKTQTEYHQIIWAKLIRCNFRRFKSEFEYVDAVLIASETNLILRKEFESLIEAIELGSPRAQQEQAIYLEEQDERDEDDKQALLELLPKKRVLEILSQIEAGQSNFWCSLCFALTLKSHSTHYGDPFASSLINLPGWIEAEDSTKERIINAARLYLSDGDPESQAWLGTNNLRNSALVGYQALNLLLQKAPNLIFTLSAEEWQKWTAIILAYPNWGRTENREHRQELIKKAYQNAPSEFIRVLMISIEKENQEYGFVDINRLIKNCWDEKLAKAVFDKVQDKELTDKSLGDLLEDLLRYGFLEAKAFAESLILSPLPSSSDKRAKAVAAAKALILYTEDAGWPVVWPAIQQDTEFGREVIEKVSSHIKYNGSVEQRLKEEYIADLYIFLAKQYPDSDDKKQNSSEDKKLTDIDIEAYTVTPQHSIKTWKEYIPKRLQERGTPQALEALRKIIRELPELKDKLQWRLLEAEALIRRQTWQPLKPEQILQIVTHKKSSPMKTILILAANPNNSTPLRLGEEVREIDEGLRRSQKRDQFRLEQKWAVRAADVRRALLDHEPQIVHFCGHGSGNEGLVLEDENGQSKLVTTEALANTFELCTEHVECVLLNACYSEVQAEAIVEHIDYVIGMNDAIGDAAAIHFATGFYDALGAGKSIENAYKWGCNAIQSENLPDHLKPKLKKKK